ncbi:MAG: tRNA (adenosine(37)-N6)-dimethylallyltransferase MiaA [Acidimicrobiaceae bacterium]|nr:tRNA (adenosine(37)-N6)-dimethylallyltransferase MiaA [Acidimicrobiaceae bacterium]
MDVKKSRVFPLLALVGPTASGKTQIAMELAAKFDRLELVSIDSMTVYRLMDVGTAKPGQKDLEGIRYHLLDMVDPWEEYSVYEFQRDARLVLNEIAERKGIALLVGGTGLYYQAMVDGLVIPGRWPEIRIELEAIAGTEQGVALLYERLRKLDPIGAMKMQPTNARRIVRALEVTLGSGKPFSEHGPGLFADSAKTVQAVGIDLPRSLLFERIERRLDHLLASGWTEEVANLINDPRGASRTARQALGYKEIINFLEGNSTLEEARLEILSRSKRFAKRQLAWFRRDPRIAWFNTAESAKIELVSILSSIAKFPSSDQ